MRCAVDHEPGQELSSLLYAAVRGLRKSGAMREIWRCSVIELVIPRTVIGHSPLKVPFGVRPKVPGKLSKPLGRIRRVM